METRAVARYIRVSPQKARLVTDMIRGKDLLEAQHMLEYSEKAVASVLSKLLASAAANAENNNSLKLEDLYIARAYVDEGPTLPHRYRMRAMGRVGRIRKRTSHITVVLEEREPGEGTGKKRRFAIRRPKREKPEQVVETEELEEEELEEEELETGEEVVSEDGDGVELESKSDEEDQASEDIEEEAKEEPEEPEASEEEEKPSDDEDAISTGGETEEEKPVEKGEE